MSADSGTPPTARSGVVVAGLSPHPPIIIPEVGGAELHRAKATVDGVTAMARRMVAANPRTIVIVGPHGPVMRHSFVALGNHSVTGNLGDFGAVEVTLTFRTDTDLLASLIAEASAGGLSVTDIAERQGRAWGTAAEMDYATLVPLYYLAKAGFSGRVLVMSMAYTDLKTCFDFGGLIDQAARKTGVAIGVLASGDLSHRLKPGAPAGYDPRGAQFDQILMQAVGDGDPGPLLAMDPELIEAAGECGLRPTMIMLGAASKAKLRPEVLSYEGPFGVGYGVAIFERNKSSAQAPVPAEHALVSLARRTINTFVREGNVIVPPTEPLGAELPKEAGAFVSLHLAGELRGCIGTIAPTRDSLNEEIVHNAIAAATEDPRFSPLTPSELDDLEISVDVLGPPEPIADISRLDPKLYGVIVEKGPRRGLLLPDLEGVDTVGQQVSIAAQKAGLSPRDPALRLYRFSVVRYH